MTIFITRRIFSKDMTSEITDLTWTLKNFRATAAANEVKNLETTFQAGDSIGLPTQWRLVMPKEGDKLGIYFKLVQSPEEVQKLWATFGYEILGKITDPFHPPEEMKSSNKRGLGFPKATDSLEQITDEHLTNGNLVIKIKVILLKDKKCLETPEYKWNKFNTESLLGVRDDFQKLLDSGKKSDLTIHMADGETLKAHQVILTARSPVFAAMFESQMKETSSGLICIEEMTSQAMKTLLKFIYTGQVDKDWAEVIEEIVYAAEKYQLDLLKKFCDENMAASCTPENAWRLMKIAQLFGLKSAEIEIDWYIEAHFSEIIQAKKTSLAQKS